MNSRHLSMGIVAALVSTGSAAFLVSVDCSGTAFDPQIADMIKQVDEEEILNTVSVLQGFTSRYYGYPGNAMASSYLHGELSNITGLTVEYQGGDLRNIIATLPGKESSKTFIVGAHYDSENSADLSYAPGATDTGGGGAIVLELARIMSRYTFEHTVVFALWNAEEGGTGMMGSTAYVQYAKDNGLDIALYFNFDSTCYDPHDRLVLDIMYNDRSRCMSSLMTQCNSLYHIGFTLTYNAHTCGSDHRPFWEEGYTAVMTHEEEHGPAHTADDTVDKISTAYAKKNAQLGMSAVACLAGVQAPADQ